VKAPPGATEEELEKIAEKRKKRIDIAVYAAFAIG
jgi:hypothetical protein